MHYMHGCRIYNAIYARRSGFYIDASKGEISMFRECTAAFVLLMSTAAWGQTGVPLSEDDKLLQQGKPLLLSEHPEVMRAIMAKYRFTPTPGASSSGAAKALLASGLLSDSPDRVAAALAAAKVERPAPGIWFVEFPVASVGIVETKRGLVVFDTGAAWAGPALVKLIPTLSSKPVTHIVVSHIHIDHAYGWTALKKRWPNAKTITSDLFPAMAAKEIRLSGSIGRYNDQPLELQPTSLDRLPRPDITFRDRLSLKIDGEPFEFFHSPGETEEQIWMSLPQRQAILAADYYQDDDMPNWGNGKRIVRHLDEWAAALRTMIALKPKYLLAAHAKPVEGEENIAAKLGLQADALEYISNQVVQRLNAGERKDVIAATFEWPDRFAKNPDLEQKYTRVEDVARMVAMRWTGWWDDIPSHFAPMRFEEESQEILRLAGGLDAVDARARQLLPTNPNLAARLADWAYYGAPNNRKALQLTIDVYLARMAAPDTPLQETNVYVAQAAKARAKLQNLTTSTSGASSK